MKKNYVYIIAPVVATALFTGFYWKYSATYDERIAEMHRKEVETAQAKLNEDAKNREIAAKAAYASQERRKWSGLPWLIQRLSWPPICHT